MNLPVDTDSDDFDIDTDSDTPDDASLESEARFAGDTGTLPVPARRVLVRLLQGPSLDARRHEKLWTLLKRYEKDLRSRLHDVFLELLVDNESKVAFCRQVVSDEVDVPILLRRQSLSFIESVLLLFLRQKLTHSDAQAERAVVDQLEMTEYLRAYERSDNLDQSRFGRQMESAIEKAKKLGILSRLPGGVDRFEISATLRLLFPVEEVQALTEAYRRQLPADAVAQSQEAH
ncbi:DUF4194 domain-containing protein [Variovorax sp. J22G21]|uniref:DUF4194 domain-containing protein n=1 Tax=Variovorax fucosicus TaxID=3053517 RepID=UPI002577121D|nr:MULTISPECIES: DUF4194 domain-containing protein [unclassified Variovorax]MDM0040748.1 DUF4194 domain-containing protein [Variovorax sp. J22R193]MDM0062121.1 DUF4194 domain-containing protein [Variovorax sp. J22G21]